MPRRSARELEHEMGHLRSDTPATDMDVCVEWREADPEARPTGMEWDAGSETATLTYDLWSAQRETLDELEGEDPPDVGALLGGYGSGKSIFGARWLIAQALEYPGSHFLAMGQTFSEARTSTFQVLFEQLPGERTALRTSSYNGPETSPIVSDYNRAEHRLTLINDSVITLGSGDKWSRFAGAEFGGIWMDEPSHYGEDLHDLLEMMGSRLRGVDGPKTQLWTLTGNGYNAAYTILEQREDANGEDLGLEIELVRASTLNNPYHDEADRERFARQFSGTAREEQALHGGFAAAQGLVYSSFTRDVHVVSRAEALDLVDPDARHLYGYDAGWRDPRTLLEIAKTDYGQLIVLDEYHESESHVEEAVAWLKANDKPRGPIYCEHEPSDIEKFKRAGYAAKKAEKSIDAGISEVRGRLELDDAGRPGLLISETCENLIRELLGYREEQVGTSSAVDHCADALRYAVFSPAANLTPKRQVHHGTPTELARARDTSETASNAAGGKRRVVRRRSPSASSRRTKRARDRDTDRDIDEEKRRYFRGGRDQ